jgi:hypothetical protein
MITIVPQWDETEWLRAAASNPAFYFLNDPAEDIYSLSDGEPFRDQISRPLARPLALLPLYCQMSIASNLQCLLDSLVFGFDLG